MKNINKLNSEIKRKKTQPVAEPQDNETLDLGLPPKPSSTWINSICSFSDYEGTRCVRVRDHVLFSYDKGDVEAEKIAVVYLFREGWAQQQELSASFNYATSTIRTWRQKIERDGIAGAARKKRRSPSLKLGGTKDVMVSQLFASGLSNYAIGRRLGVGEHAVRLALKRLGLKREKKAKESDLFAGFDNEQKESSTGNDQSVTPVGHDIQIQTAPGVESMESSLDKEEQITNTQSEETGQLPSKTCLNKKSSEKYISEENREVSVDSEDVSIGDSAPQIKKSHAVLEIPPEPVSDNNFSVVVEKELELPVLHEAPFSLDSRGEDRSLDRLMATIGLLNDGVPVFRKELRCWGVGVLLTIPFILGNNILEAFQKVYGSINGFFGLRNSVMSLLIMGFLRIKRLEQLKEKEPSSLGGVIGLDRLPEVKTLRRKLKAMASPGKALSLMRLLAHIRMKKQSSKNLLGFLYVDGHVKEYHGLAKLGKTYVTRRHFVNKGSTDMWLHDASGGPLFVVPCELNQSLTQMLEKVLDEIKPLFGDRRPTIIFDRGGWKKALFERLIDANWDIITYRKGWKAAFSEGDFQEKTMVVNGDEVTYKYHEMSVCISEINLENEPPKRYWMRQITRLKKGRQIPVMTTRQDLEPLEILYWMFNRWRQENYFKYGREEYLLDALWTYDWNDVPDNFDRPNPEWEKCNKKYRKTRDKLGTLLVTQNNLQQRQKLITAELLKLKNTSETKKSIRSSKAKLTRLNKRLTDMANTVSKIETQVEKLRMDRDQSEKRIPASDLECLHQGMGLISNSIKMIVYQIESELLDRVAKYYSRVSKDGRKLIVAALHSEGTIEATNQEIQVTLNKQSYPHRTKAIKSLCEELNQMNVYFPGTQLKMRSDVAS